MKTQISKLHAPLSPFNWYNENQNRGIISIKFFLESKARIQSNGKKNKGDNFVNAGDY